MENKNVFIAIALSMSVLLFWSAFVDSPQLVEKQKQKVLNTQPENKIADNGIVPSINGTIVKENISRKDSLKKTNRVLLENKKIKGAINTNYTYIVFGKSKAYEKDHKILFSTMQKSFEKF